MLDFRKIRLNANIQKILDDLGLVYQQKGNEFVVRCMSGNHADDNPSWSIHTEPGEEKNGLFSCWSCKWSGDIFDLVCHMKGFELSEAYFFVSKFADDLANGDFDDEQLTKRYFPVEVKEPEGLLPIVYGSKCSIYLLDRGFSIEMCHSYGFKDWVALERVWIPIQREGILITWLARSYVGGKPKILTPKGNTLGAKWGIWGLDTVDRNLKVVHICEGWASAMRVRQLTACGYAGATNAIAICGSRIYEEQISELAWVGKIVLWKEGDIGGTVLEQDMKNWFSGTGKKLLTIPLPEGKDPADFSISELDEYLKGAKYEKGEIE